jgi:membrane protease YdiL (CAAX protease family)
MSAFLLVLVAGWIVLSLYYTWRSSSHLSFHLVSFRLDPRLLVCAAFPAWILSGIFSKDAGVRGLVKRLVHPSDSWTLLAFLLFPLILGLPAIVAYLLHRHLMMPMGHGGVLASVAVAMVMFLYNLLFAAVLEEPGWRGFLLDRLQRRYSPLLASLIVWLPWALWHAPLDYFRPVRFSLVMYLEIRVIFLIPLVIILTWLYNRSGRSIQTAVIFHASMNTFPFVLPYFMPGFALLFVVAAYAVVADRMWRRQETVPLQRSMLTTGELRILP